MEIKKDIIYKMKKINAWYDIYLDLKNDFYHLRIIYCIYIYIWYDIYIYYVEVYSWKNTYKFSNKLYCKQIMASVENKNKE